MKQEILRRREVVQLYYYQHLSKAEICRQLGCSRPWLDRWLNRYDPDNVELSLQDRTRGPRQGHSRWSPQIRQQVVEMRRLRSQGTQWPYALKGAAAIHYELHALYSPEVPPIRTIHSWLVKAGLIEPPQVKSAPRETKAIPLPTADTVNAVHQLDLKGPIYLRGSSQKYYFAVLRDCYSRRCALHVLESREAQGIVEFLVASWQWLGLPTYLQMDNALEFRGSNRYPRSFGRVVRVAVDLSVEPIFNPPREPWRNGGVERHNGFVGERVLAIDCPDLTALQREIQACQTACNQTHRLTALNGLTPNEIAKQATLHLLSPDYQRYHLRSLPQNHGFVSFVRLVRKSGRITLGAGDRFMIDPSLAATYVLARVNLAQKIVVISQENKILKIYDYSANTVGKWAADTQDDPVKELNCNTNYCTSEH